MQKTHAELEARTGRSPTVIEVAEHLRVEVEDVVEALDAIVAQRPVSFDAPLEAELDEGINTRHELLGDVDHSYALVDSSVSLDAAVRQLPEADQRVLRLRLRDELTQREIAAALGVSQMQVSRILRRIVDQLREPMDIGPGAQPRRRQDRQSAQTALLQTGP